MERQRLDLSEWAFILINVPLIFFSLTANIFYACCLISVSRGQQKLKEPLKTQLGCLVCCSIIYCVSLPFLCYVLKECKGYKVFVISWAFVIYFMYNSLTCYVRLNFYFYIQIVPARRALWIWVKRNIKSVMFGALLLDQMFFLLNSFVNVKYQVSQHFTCFNSTWIEYRFEVDLLNIVIFYSFRAYILMCLCFTSISSFSMTCYLYGHIRNVALNGSSFNKPRIKKHMRIAITGICQGVVFFLYVTYYLFDSFTEAYSPHFVVGFWAVFTFNSLYISATTVNLGIGQALFRQRAARIWKALKALCHVGVVTRDGKLTSGEIADTLNC